jgi:antitoxin ParD1/3/4
MPSLQKAEKISITLPPDMLLSIKTKVKAGLYGSTSEVIREAMRLWQKREEEHEARLASIRDRLERSANSGTPSSIDDVFERLEKRHKKTMSTAVHEDL